MLSETGHRHRAGTAQRTHDATLISGTAGNLEGGTEMILY